MYRPDFHVSRFEVFVLFQRTFEETHSMRIMLFKLSALQNVAQNNSAVHTRHLFPVSEQDGVIAVFAVVATAWKVD